MGKWIFKNKARHDNWSEFECSECGNIILATARDFSLHLFDYCSKCGSKMGEKVARPTATSSTTGTVPRLKELLSSGLCNTYGTGMTSIAF